MTLFILKLIVPLREEGRDVILNPVCKRLNKIGVAYKYITAYKI